MKEVFIFLKLGSGNCLADYWLSYDNVLGFPAAVIYFGIPTAEDIKELYEYYNKIHDLRVKWKNEGKIKNKNNKKNNDYDYLIKNREQIVAFYGVYKEKGYFITVTPHKIYIYEAVDDIQNLEEDLFEEYNEDLNKRKIKKWKIEKNKETKTWNHIPKYMRVNIIKEIENRESIPYILRSLHSNRGYNKKTCVKIVDKGIIEAIKYAWLKIKAKPKNEIELLELLSPIEFETLIFLILTEAGLHVPAWRGATLKDVDIIAKNLSSQEIKLTPVILKPGDVKSFQVKRKKDYNERVKNVDFVVTLSSERYLTARWVIEQVKKYPRVKEWLKNSLWWVSEEAIIKLLE